MSKVISGKKVIIFGEAGVGKTSTILTSFFGYPFDAIKDLKPTKGISIESVKFRGLVNISVWDCAGQDKYMAGHFSETGKIRIFSEIDIAVFIMDASRDATLNANFVDKFLDIVLEYNPTLEKIYIFINKMDIAPKDINDRLMTLSNDILKKWNKGRIQIINCSVKLGTTKQQFIQVLDSIIQQDKKVKDLQNFIKKCLDDFSTVVKGKFALFHLPSLLMIASTYTIDDVSWIGEEEFLLNKKVDLKSLCNNDNTIHKIDDEYIISTKLNNNSVLLTIADRDKVSDPQDLISTIKDHETFSALNKITYLI